eukprot:tig00000430_g662.t1
MLQRARSTSPSNSSGYRCAGRAGCTAAGAFDAALPLRSGTGALCMPVLSPIKLAPLQLAVNSGRLAEFNLSSTCAASGAPADAAALGPTVGQTRRPRNPLRSALLPSLHDEQGPRYRRPAGTREGAVKTPPPAPAPRCPRGRPARLRPCSDGAVPPAVPSLCPSRGAWGTASGSTSSSTPGPCMDPDSQARPPRSARPLPLTLGPPTLTLGRPTQAAEKIKAVQTKAIWAGTGTSITSYLGPTRIAVGTWIKDSPMAQGLRRFALANFPDVSAMGESTVLACPRLAPIMIDCFVSGTDVEPPGASAACGERLLLLGGCSPALVPTTPPLLVHLANRGRDTRKCRFFLNGGSLRGAGRCGADVLPCHSPRPWPLWAAPPPRPAARAPVPSRCPTASPRPSLPCLRPRLCTPEAPAARLHPLSATRNLEREYAPAVPPTAQRRPDRRAPPLAVAGGCLLRALEALALGQWRAAPPPRRPAARSSNPPSRRVRRPAAPAGGPAALFARGGPAVRFARGGASSPTRAASAGERPSSPLARPALIGGPLRRIGGRRGRVSRAKRQGLRPRSPNGRRGPRLGGGTAGGRTALRRAVPRPVPGHRLGGAAYPSRVCAPACPGTRRRRPTSAPLPLPRTAGWRPGRGSRPAASAGIGPPEALKGPLGSSAAPLAEGGPGAEGPRASSSTAGFRLWLRAETAALPLPPPTEAPRSPRGAHGADLPVPPSAQRGGQAGAGLLSAAAGGRAAVAQWRRHLASRLRPRLCTPSPAGRPEAPAARLHPLSATRNSERKYAPAVGAACIRAALEALALGQWRSSAAAPPPQPRRDVDRGTGGGGYDREGYVLVPARGEGTAGILEDLRKGAWAAVSAWDQRGGRGPSAAAGVPEPSEDSMDGGERGLQSATASRRRRAGGASVTQKPARVVPRPALPRYV